MNAEEAAAQVIRENRYLTLATSDGDGPWATPLAYTVEPDFTFVFYTTIATRHTQHILETAKVAGAIFNSTLPSDTVDGVQFRGACNVVADHELKATMSRYFEASFPDPQVRSRWLRPESDFTAHAPQKFFRIKLTELGKPDPTSPKTDRRMLLNAKLVHEAFLRIAKS